MEIINPIYRLMNFNQPKNKMNPINQNMQSLSQINQNLNPNSMNINNRVYNSNINNINNSLFNNSTQNINSPNNLMNNNNSITNINPNFMNMNTMNNMNMNNNMNMLNNNMKFNNGYTFNNNPIRMNPMLLNSNSMINNNIMCSPFFNNNNMMMPQPFFCNNFFQAMNNMPLQYPYPFLNNTINHNSFNFIGSDGLNDNINHNDNNNQNENNNGNENYEPLYLNLENSLFLNDYYLEPHGEFNKEEYIKLKKQFVKELDVYQYKNKDKFDSSLIEDECSICLSKYKITDMLKILPCKHGFHKKCINKWLSDEQHNKCPLCNLDIKAEVNKRKTDLEKHIYDAEHENE